MKKEWLKGFLVLAMMMAQVFYAGHVMAADEPAKGHREVIGTVQKVEGDLISVKTGEGTTRNFTVKEGQREGFKSMKPGDQVVLEMDEGNQIVDIHPKGMLSSKGTHGHRSITGTVENFSRSDKTMKVKTKEGKTESFGIKDSALAKLGSIKEGSQITVEVDEQNRVMDAHLAGH
jgi:cold shock CspA family protein